MFLYTPELKKPWYSKNDCDVKYCILTVTLRRCHLPDIYGVKTLTIAEDCHWNWNAHRIQAENTTRLQVRWLDDFNASYCITEGTYLVMGWCLVIAQVMMSCSLAATVCERPYVLHRSNYRSCLQTNSWAMLLFGFILPSIVSQIFHKLLNCDTIKDLYKQWE